MSCEPMPVFWYSGNTYDEELPPHSFLLNNASYDVPCCFQIWQRMPVRHKEFVVPKNMWFELLTQEEALESHRQGSNVVALRRVGSNSGEVLEGPPQSAETSRPEALV